MWLRLDLDGLRFELQVEDYQLPKYRKDWDAWCDVLISLNDSRLVKWAGGGSVIESREIDSLRDSLRGLLKGEYTEDVIEECVEPDFAFVFHPKGESTRLHDTNDMNMDFLIRLWGNGYPSNNYLSLNFHRENVELLLAYLDLISQEKSTDDPEIQAMLNNGILYREV
jgi:hypothetical protein